MKMNFNTNFRRRNSNVSKEQKNILLEFMRKHPQLMSGKFSYDFSFKDAQAKWLEVTSILNNCKRGASKDWKTWRKTWNDMRCWTKAKMKKNWNHENGTDSGIQHQVVKRSCVRKKNSVTSKEQKNILLEFMRKHPQLMSGKFSNDFSVEDAEAAWLEITNILNNCERGPSKNWESWRKTWHHIQYRERDRNNGTDYRIQSKINISCVRERNFNATREQKNILLQFMRKHPKLVSGKFSEDFSVRDAQTAWLQVTNILNACEGGASKDWKSWRKTWHDLRSRTKAKRNSDRNHESETDCGPLHQVVNFNFENEVLEAIKQVSVDRNPKIPKVDFNLTGTKYSGKKSESNSLLSTSFEENINDNNNYNDSVVINNIRPTVYSESGIKLKEYSVKKNYKRNFDINTKQKTEYMKKKFLLLERIAVSKQQSAEAKKGCTAGIVRFASAMEEITDNLEYIIKTIHL